MGSALGSRSTVLHHDDVDAQAQAQELGSLRSSPSCGIHITVAQKNSAISINSAAYRKASRPASPKRSCWCRHGGVSLLLGARPLAKVRPVSSSEEEGSIELGNRVIGTAPASPATHVRKAPWCGEDIKEEQGGSLNAEASNGVSCLGRLLSVYSDCLDKHPVITKSVSSGFIGLLGDLTAQSVEWGFGGAPVPWNGKHAIWRSCAVMIDGFFINGPLLHYAYEVLEAFMPAEENMLSAVLQVGVDVFVIDPVFAFIFVWSTGLIEGRSVQDEIIHTIEYDYPNMVVWLIVIGLSWAPLQVYLFNKYPVQFRVLFADIIDLVWTCVTSFFCHV